MQDATEIKRYCERQCQLLSVRAEEMEANNISATPVRAMIAAYDDVLDFIARPPQNEKSRSLREQKEAQK